ncbi:uncharacterized protein LTHEOB_8335 [Lasiodiplodia theobromae]|uniref:uncharacterized protein n=1 Tax=Lasiodiplodia theobromae TaxID=45133 RepID=UPI0015C338F9|nr:uncharacterized protein LTHEOB_8335 [Lasiodiplodia theobromae]KAF4541754.1 hypothetical protein LTHEOB_8335 [Lasiodiplodia theobromae]
MADASAIQKRPRGRPRKQQQVVAAAEVPVIDIVIDAALAKPNKPAPTKTKKLKDEKQMVSSAKPAPDKKTTKKSTASSGTNGSVTITKRKAATTKQTAADPPAAAAAASITPPSSAPQASSTSTRLQQRRKAAEPIPGPSIEPTGTIPSGTKPVEEAIATATNRSKILSELAAQGSLPLQREEKDSGTEAARAEEGRQAQRALLCDTLQQEEVHAQVAVRDELQRQEELARTASASAATQFTLSGRSTQTEDAAAGPAQLEPHTSPASAITPPPPPPTTAALSTIPTPPTQTTPITMAGQQQPPPPQPYRASPRQARPSQPPAPAAPKPVEEGQPWEPPQVRQWRQKQEQQRQSKWKPVEPLPLKYKPAARRVTLAMVAAPIAIVTSWALYDRLVLGKERKEMPRVAPSLANAMKDRDAEDKKM